MRRSKLTSTVVEEYDRSKQVEQCTLHLGPLLHAVELNKLSYAKLTLLLVLCPARKKEVGLAIAAG